MKTQKNTTEAPGKPFMVRLPNASMRKAFEAYCRDQRRSMDGQASIIIIKELTALGYITAEISRTDTQ